MEKDKDLDHRIGHFKKTRSLLKKKKRERLYLNNRGRNYKMSLKMKK